MVVPEGLAGPGGVGIGDAAAEELGSDEGEQAFPRAGFSGEDEHGLRLVDAEADGAVGVREPAEEDLPWGAIREGGADEAAEKVHGAVLWLGEGWRGEDEEGLALGGAGEALAVAREITRPLDMAVQLGIGEGGGGELAGFLAARALVGEMADEAVEDGRALADGAVVASGIDEVFAVTEFVVDVLRGEADG